MRPILFSFLVASLFSGSAIAQDLGNSRVLPVKNTPVVIYEPPAVPKQGGDTIADAHPIDGLPFSDSGSTVGYADDYDAACPWEAASPDVVYSFTPSLNMKIDVDLCGSSYDTKTYIFSEDWDWIACNDDYYWNDAICGHYTSFIQEAFLVMGVTYYIFIDADLGDSGDYILNISESEPCVLTCPDDAVDEGEPALGNGYEDAYNGGCLSPDIGHPFQTIDWTNDADGVPPYDGYAWLCGKSGWYLNPEGVESRDTDWYRVIALQDGVMEFTVESEYLCRMFKLAPLDCETVAVELDAFTDCHGPRTLTFPVTAGEEIWLWVGPTNFTGPVTEFTYFMTVSNNTFDTVPAEEMSWGRVKSLYR